MKTRLFLSAILVVFICSAWAKTKTVEGNYTFYIPETMSPAQAEEEAIRRAKIDALNKAFGSSVVGSNVSILTQDEERFYSNGFDLVRGEWIETIGQPEITKSLEGGDYVLTVKIRGKAREKKTADVDISAKILRNGLTQNCEDREFKSGDKMYLYFLSPIDGYLSVYQHDPVDDMVYCLLPYRRDGGGSVEVQHDKEYIFFSKAASENPRIVDEYRLGCSEDGDVNTIYILFSPNKFSKSSTVVSGKTAPGSISFREFEVWRAKSQAQDASMQVILKNLIISK